MSRKSHAAQSAALCGLPGDRPQTCLLANCPGLSMPHGTIRSGDGAISLSLSNGELLASRPKEKPAGAIAESAYSRVNLSNLVATIG